MNKKTLLILAGVFIVLAIAASYPQWRESVGFTKSPVPTSELSFSLFTQEATEQVVISKKDEEEKMLVKKNGMWVINNLETSEKAVDDFFEALTTLEAGSLVSKNKENFSGFGVDDTGYTLALSRNGKVTTFIVGSNGPSLGSFYARMKDGANVYLVEGKLPDTLSQSVSFWRDKTLIKVSKDEIQKIEVVSTTSPLLITKTKEGKWLAENVRKNAVLDEATAKSMLDSLGSLEGSDFLTKEQEAEFKKASGKTILRLFDGTNKKLAEVQLLKKDSDWWAITESQSFFYKVPAYKLSSVLLTQEQVFGGDN